RSPGSPAAPGGASAASAAGGAGAGPAQLDLAGLATALRTLLAGVSGVLSEVRQAQDELRPRAEASARAWDELRRAADGVAESATGQAVIARMAALTETLAADPLSLSAADFDAVDDAIAAAHAAVTSGEALREHLSERLAAGRALLEALPALLTEAR